MNKLIGIYYKMCTESCGSYKLSVGRAREINLAFKLRLSGRGDGISGSGSRRAWWTGWGRHPRNRVWLLGVGSGRNVVIGWGWGTSKFVLGMIGSVHRHKSGSLVLSMEIVFPLKQ